MLYFTELLRRVRCLTDEALQARTIQTFPDHSVFDAPLAIIRLVTPYGFYKAHADSLGNGQCNLGNGEDGQLSAEATGKPAKPLDPAVRHSIMAQGTRADIGSARGETPRRPHGKFVEL